MSHIDKQPGATAGMSASSGNRNVKNLPVEGNGREWSNGLFSCCDDSGTCMMACFCPCVVHSQVKHRYEHLESKGYPDPEHGGGFCGGDCMAHACLTYCGIGFFLQAFTRGNIRKRYNIKGGFLGDCCSSLWCTPCELTQAAQELELEEQSYGH
ncbi:PLAC8 family-domain-containing protein [Cyathus striatus]|nr:PLAC8 family-domain-containing protein [Cyathus striatus]